MQGRIIIVGGGQAACQFTASLRQLGYTGDVVLIGDEPQLPYQRPPLSKAFLKGTASAESLQLRPASFYENVKCDYRLGERVEHIDRDASEIVFGNGERLSYTHLVLATGARARMFPGLPDPEARIHYLRSLGHAQSLKTALPGYKRIAIVGAGYVGMEVAASARQLGIEVTVLEAASRIMQRSVGDATSERLQAAHKQHGVAIRLGCSIRSVQALADSLIVHTDGDALTVDAVVVGIGAIPNIELALSAGIDCARGILVDAQGRTSDPHIFAIGDCTEQTHGLYGPGLRLESVQNAMDQAKSAAAELAGRSSLAATVPWFWSDQYEHRLQVAGLPIGHDAIVVRKPAQCVPGTATQSVWYLCQGRVLCVEALDAPEDFMVGRTIIRDAAVLNTALLADASQPLQQPANSIASAS